MNLRCPILILSLLAWASGSRVSAGPSQDRTSATDGTWWSLRRLTQPSPPPVPAGSYSRNPIDAFVLARLQSAHLQPAPPASPRNLIRRLFFDLLGLPPTPEEMARWVPAFDRDRVTATEHLVDALLRSPHYGEHWARHWLDVARFGESDGFEYDRLRPHAWRYRDWVIRALNADLPYDQFARWQIAGDVLAPDDADAVIATGFLVGGAFDGLIPQGDVMRKIMREDEMEDLVGTVGQTFLGLTVHCARCHDHKFDPVSQEEYYRMASGLAGVRRGDRSLPAGETQVTLRRRLADLTERLQTLEAPVKARLLSHRSQAAQTTEPPPQPLAQWDFHGDLRDSLGGLHGEAHGEVKIEDGALHLDGETAYVTTGPLPRTLLAKTLEAVVRVDPLNQRGGSVLGIQSLDGGVFDALVYAEREPRRWMAGSNGFQRTRDLGGGDETAEEDEWVHLALVYSPEGAVTLYRNGRPYGESYSVPSPIAFEAGQAQILFGLRHGTGATVGRMFAGFIDQARLFDRALSPGEIAQLAGQPIVTEAALVAALSADQREARRQWIEARAQTQSALEALESRRAYAVTPQPAPVTRFLARGNPLQPRDVVTVGGIAAVQGLSPDPGLPADAPEADRRRALAAWITHPSNPLFARTIVNRVWHYHFGQGLVPTPNDLGVSGGQPSHPELLDWLAGTLRVDGWSLKRLHRRLLTSETYAQSTRDSAAARAVDAGNRLLWRHAPARLEAESLRDTLLVVSGRWNPTVGGEGYRDFEMEEHKSSMVYHPVDLDDPAANRRSIYRTWARGGRQPFLTAFDCPDPSATAPVRGATITPLGALTLMNNVLVLRLAAHCAERVRVEAGASPAAQVRRVYQLALARDPGPEELRLGSDFVDTHGLAAYCRVLFNANEFLYLN